MSKKSKCALFLAFFAFWTIPFDETFSTDAFDPYRTLGLEMGATQNEIKQAYKRLAMEWHPDRNKSPGAQERFMEVNRAYEILSSAEKREAYDKFGTMDDNFGDWRNYQEQFFKEQQHFQQYIRWPPPPRRQQNDLKNFILPFASVLGTLFFIFLIGFLLNQMNAVEANNRRRQHRENEESSTTRGNSGGNKGTKEQQEWHPEDPKTPLTEEEKQQRVQTRIWRTMGPLIHELRAETQFGLIRLLKPGCRSIIVLVDRESKETLLHQFARYTYCLRNNKTFSFGFLVVPKNLNWFRSLLELTLPGDEPEESKEDLNSLTTVTTDTNSDKTQQQEKEPDEKGPILGQFTKAQRNEADEKKITAKNRLKNINPKHTVGTILVICGWKLYFSIYHPMHRPSSLRARAAAVQLETLGDNDEEEEQPKCWEDEDIFEGEKGAKHSREQRKGSGSASKEGKGDKLNVENVLNGFPTFLERLLEGTVRRYYIPEWPDNLV